MHSEELQNLYTSLHIIIIIIMIKSMIRWAGHSMHGRKEKCIQSHLEDIGIDGRIILKCISGKLGLRVWIRFIWLRIGTACGLLCTW
jgi:hypothetical protein